jgi:hypothetical protein
MTVSPMFAVIRRCPPGECEAGCNCHVVEVLVDVDELDEGERARVQAAGDDAQRAELAAWLAAEAAPPPSCCCSSTAVVP